jgi:hypothetical protein
MSSFGTQARFYGTLFLAALVGTTLGPAAARPTGALSFSNSPLMPRSNSAHPKLEMCEGTTFTSVTYWLETSASPLQFSEFITDYFWVGGTNPWRACGGGELPNTTCFAGVNGCPTKDEGPTPPGNVIHSDHDICLSCFATTSIYATPSGVQGGIDIGKFVKKNTKISYTLLTGSLLPVGVAAGPGTIYASMLGSGGNSAVYIYNVASQATKVLSVPTGVNAAGVGVDAASNVYWAANPTSGSEQGELWKFPHNKSGYGAPTILVASNTPFGGLAASKDYLAVTEPAQGLVQVYNHNAQVVATMVTGGTPQSVTVNKAQNVLTVVDSTNELVSTYQFPGGGLIHSGQIMVNNQLALPVGAAESD